MRANKSLRLASSSQALWITFGDHRKYSSHHAETESVPNVGRLLSAETECAHFSTFGAETETETEIGRPLKPCMCDNLAVQLHVSQSCIIYRSTRIILKSAWVEEMK